jgi:4-hydroxybenzoate polyprenyltransferase
MIRFRAYAQLVRLPNVFTALADICLGWLALGAPAERWWAFALLLVSSACLYCGGMIWNDFFDVEQDRRERPFRPIPSGKISRAAAGRLGAGLLTAGFLLATAAGWPAAVTAATLVAAILLYDGWLKRTGLGPLAMGACRFLNVLLGLAASGDWPPAWGWYLAAVVGIYIIGVTWFARTEARTSRKADLIAAASVMLLALLLALPAPVFMRSGASSSPLFVYLLVGLGFFVGLPVSQAIVQPKAGLVQAAVKRCIFGLVFLDAVLATAAAGTVGLLILLLLGPAMLLGRWLYST